MQPIRNANDEYQNGYSFLTYRGNVIRVEEEKLNLTDMWRAAGADNSKRPYEWSRKEGSAFIEAVGMSLNTPVERIYIAGRGKLGSTFAHWQIGLAYAKYLSPEFHMWCNTVVRREMEQPRDQMNLGNIEVLVKKLVMEAMAEFTKQIIPQMIEHRLALNPQVGAVTSVPALQVAMECGVKKRPRGFIQAVSNALTRFCEGSPKYTVHRDVYGRKLFPREAINEWLARGGWGPMKDRVDRTDGQGVLVLVGSNKDK